MPVKSDKYNSREMRYQPGSNGLTSKSRGMRIPILQRAAPPNHDAEHLANILRYFHLFH